MAPDIISSSSETKKFSFKLKFSCESCISSKVKCSGTHPTCTRCYKTNRTCVYLPRKKRIYNNPQKLKFVKQAFIAGFGECDVYGDKAKNYANTHLLLKPLTEFELPPFDNTKGLNDFTHLSPESMSWRILHRLTHLYKTRDVGCLMFEIRRQVRAFQLHLRAAEGTDNRARQNLTKLDLLLDSESLDLDRYFDQKTTMLSRITKGKRSEVDKNTFEQFSLFVKNKSNDDKGCREITYIQGCRDMLVDIREHISTRIPIFRMRLDSNLMQSKLRYIEVDLNDSFTRIFGKTSADMTLQLSSEVSGYLPFGSSVLALLASDEGELMSFIEVQCVKTLANGFFMKGYPCYQEVPNMSIMKLNCRENLNEAKFVPVEFLVTSVVRTLKDITNVFEEVYLKLEPREDLDHLFDDNFAGFVLE